MVYRCIWVCLKLGIHPLLSPHFDRENADRPVGFRDIDGDIDAGTIVEVLLGLSNDRSNDTRYAM